MLLLPESKTYLFLKIVKLLLEYSFRLPSTVIFKGLQQKKVHKNLTSFIKIIPKFYINLELNIRRATSIMNFFFFRT